MDVYEKEQKNIVEKIKDPIEKWTQDISKKIQWIQYLWDKIKNNEQSQDSFIKYISTPINYIIWFLWMITIILIIKDWIIMIGSAWDEEKKKEAFKNIKNYIITIVFIWVARLIIMLLFNMINTIW